jgi:hypothetical protein
MLHGRLHQKPFGEAVGERRRCRPLLDVGFGAQEFEIGEQHLDHAGAVDEGRDVGLGDAAPDGAKGPSDRQILEVQSDADGFHALAPCVARMKRSVIRDPVPHYAAPIRATGYDSQRLRRR